MRAKCTVLFSNGYTKIFTGFWKYVIKAISDYCDENQTETVNATWEDVD